MPFNSVADYMNQTSNGTESVRSVLATKNGEDLLTFGRSSADKNDNIEDEI